VTHHVQAEWACHLADVVVRRGGWCYYDRDFGTRLPEVAAWMAAAAGWDAARREREIAACRAELRLRA
jgi:glycerol-3-phosphate dehydrogenase